MSWIQLAIRDSAYKINSKIITTHVNLHHVKKIVYDPNVSLKLAFNDGEHLRITNNEYSSRELHDTYKRIKQSLDFIPPISSQ